MAQLIYMRHEIKLLHSTEDGQHRHLYEISTYKLTVVSIHDKWLKTLKCVKYLYSNRTCLKSGKFKMKANYHTWS